MTHSIDALTPDSGWQNLYRVGGVAALLAGILFRRNIASEVGLFSPQPPPDTMMEWFAVLESSRLLGLVYLNIFDLINYLLAGLMFLALYAVFRRSGKTLAIIAVAAGLVGITVYFASNTALSVLALSDQFAAAASEAQKASLLAAGEALLALHRFGSPGAQPGSGGTMSLLLVAVATLLFSIVMLRGEVFNRTTAVVGLLAGSLDLLYCAGFVFLPAVDGELLSVIFMPTAGLLLMVWHIMVGWQLVRHVT